MFLFFLGGLGAHRFRGQLRSRRAVLAALLCLAVALLFFATGGRRVDHVAIYAGDGRIIHASSGAGRVHYDDIGTDRGEWYLRRFVTSRRMLGGVQGA